MPGTAKAACGADGEACSDCGARQCVDSRCEPPPSALPIAQGSCLSAEPLTFDGGHAVFEGETTGYANHQDLFCGSRGTPDFVVQLPDWQFRPLRVRVTPLDSNFAPVLGVATDCYSHSSLGTTEACEAAADAGQAVTVDLTLGATGDDAYAVIEGASATSGRFKVDVWKVGESCALPIFNGNEVAAGATFGAANDSVGSCGGSGPDLVSTLQVPVRSNIRVQVVGIAAGSVPVIYLRKSCASDEVACSRFNGTGTSHTFELEDVAPGTYYLWRDDDGVGHSSSTIVTVTAVPDGDTCTTPLPLQFSAGSDGGRAQVAFTGASMSANSTLSCGVVGAKDTVFSFTTDRVFDLEASQGSYTALELRSGSCEGPSIGCADKYLRVAGLPPGDYFLWSQSASSLETLAVELYAPKAGDHCAVPRPLQFTAGAEGGDVYVQSTLSGMHDDATTSTCGGGMGPDEVFEFTTSVVLDLRASVSAANFLPIISLRSACTGGELACSAASFNDGELAVGSLPPGTYWLWIDASGTSNATQYSLVATLTAPVTSDTCLSPGTLALAAPTDGGSVLSATVTSNTSPLFNNSFGSCGGAGSEDAVYAFTLGAPATLTAAVTGSAGLRPVVYLRSSCDGSELACAVAPATNGTATTSVPLAAGTHYVWVDGLGATVGAFTLDLTAQ